MKILSTKQKLINLVSALENEDAIKYFYRLIALQLYGTSACPDSCFKEVYNMYADYEKHKKQRETNHVEKSGIDKEISDCTSAILRDVLAMGDSKDIDSLNYIKTIITDVRKELE
ncbi:MAG: hypothetical protein E7284_11775 [Lachnospiraceae bacterium]|nr:hypothetical protein [Lachnospiraceae bacterium]